MNLSLFTIALISLILAVLFFVLFIRKSGRYKNIYLRLKDVIDVEEEKAKVERQYKSQEEELSDLRKSYKEKRAIYEKLLEEISVLEEDLDFISYGIYKPHFDFDTSEKYKEKITEVRGQQKEIIRSKTAAICYKEWTVEGSKVEGRKMTNRNI
jgi:cell shape-determining protein MreC